MQKIVAIGDVHGTDTWKKIVKQAGPDTTIVFIGDYFDAFDVSGDEQIKNFKEILEFQESHSGLVYLLIGNHELHYLLEESYSGYQRDKAEEIAGLLIPLIEQKELNVAVQRGKYLMTHAGVTKTWAEDWLGSSHQFSSKGMATLLNELFEENPLAFGYQYDDDTSGYGNNIHQGPMWVRPDPLVGDAVEGFIHVVGHTQVRRIEENPNAIFIDQGKNAKEYLEIDAEGTSHKTVPLV